MISGFDEVRGLGLYDFKLFKPGDLFVWATGGGERGEEPVFYFIVATYPDLEKDKHTITVFALGQSEIWTTTQSGWWGVLIRDGELIPGDMSKCGFD